MGGCGLIPPIWGPLSASLPLGGPIQRSAARRRKRRVGLRTIILAVFIIIGCTEPMEPTGQSAPTPTAFDRASLIETRVAKQVQRTPVPTPTTAPWIRTRVARQMHPTPTPTIDPNSDFIRDLAERLPRGGHIVEVDFNHSSPRCVGIRNLILSLNFDHGLSDAQIIRLFRKQVEQKGQDFTEFRQALGNSCGLFITGP